VLCLNLLLPVLSFQLSLQSNGIGEKSTSSPYNPRMNAAQRRARIIQLWLKLPPAKRTEDGVLSFYGWLREHAPELLHEGRGDSYQLLIVELQRHVHAEARLDR
jgi:hypothetical protein